MTDRESSDKVRHELQVYRGEKEERKKEDASPEGESLSLQCVNSSDFVVGKQTTFNGPVTIINYAEGGVRGIDDIYEPAKEEVVLRQKVITPATVSEIKAFAEKKIDNSQRQSKNSSFIKRILKSQPLNVPIIILIILVVVIIVGCLVYFLGTGEYKPLGTKTILGNSRTIAYNGTEYNYFTRQDWKAKPPLSRVEMKTPVPYVIISHTASQFCFVASSCTRLVRNIQADHLSRTPVPFSDIIYSFLIGGDGSIYEARGWTTRTATTGHARGKSLNINLIGSFEGMDSPTYPQLEAAKALIEYGVNNSYIDRNYVLISDNSTYATLSPGIQVYAEIKNWPHFNSNPWSE